MNNDPHHNDLIGSQPVLPHHRLRVYGLALEMLVVVRDAGIRDVKLRDEALRAAKGLVSISRRGRRG